MTDVDITQTIAPKTDQLNADDFIGSGDKVIKITGVKMMDSKEQPIAISYEGDKGKPWKPSLGMRRVLVDLWGQKEAKETNKYYTGRTIVLYRDPDVKFGKDTVGGIRIRAASDIAGEKKMAVTVSKARRVEFSVKPLGKVTVAPPEGSGVSIDELNALQNTINHCITPDDYRAAAAKVKAKYDALSIDQAEKISEILKGKREELKAANAVQDKPKCAKCDGKGSVDFVDEITGETGIEPCPDCQPKN